MIFVKENDTMAISFQLPSLLSVGFAFDDITIRYCSYTFVFVKSIALFEQVKANMEKSTRGMYFLVFIV